ncbi:hypothetical protein Acr_00g0040630 [Actinidia rufa]|uniref:K Homology domain-containing protein n=1 Tax=Actinidia rufa TaxID=165716 RepID=A0A7J0DJN1_9ERIC|nr:hypothetical protein Acr_00g0040630 [Actinidia rufa]
MAEPTETPALPTPAPEDTDKRSHPEKRPREEDGNDASGEARGDAPPAKRRMKSLLDIVYRIVVPSRQIGKVIGKVGARIQKIREETKATIKIADAIAVSPLNFFHLVPSVWLLGKFSVAFSSNQNQPNLVNQHEDQVCRNPKSNERSIRDTTYSWAGGISLSPMENNSMVWPGNMQAMKAMKGVTPLYISMPPKIAKGLLKQPTHYLPCGQRGNLDRICSMICDLGRCHLQEVLQGVLLGFLQVARKRHEERVIIISSKDSDNTTSDAENALLQIASLILKDDDVNVEATKVGAGHVAANTIRLLIAGTQAGGLIGVSGQNIEKLRISSGATITVLAQNQLPLCASAHESDRVVQVSYAFFSYDFRTRFRVTIFHRDNPPSQVIALSPTYNYGSHRPPQQYVDPTSADYVTLEMMISETIIGGLIGRCGSNISRIRSESGATIKVYGGKGEQKFRQLHIGGSAQQVALAKQRVDEYTYSQFIQQAGAQQPIDPSAGMMNTLAPYFTPTNTNEVPAFPGLPFHAPPL